MPEPTPGSRITILTRDFVNRVAGVFGANGLTVSGNANGQTRQEPWFGPGQPLPPVAPPAQVAGRAFDYPNLYNNGTRTREYEGVTFEQLENLSDHDIVRLAIETRKDQMSALKWSILPVLSPGEQLRGPPDQRCQDIEQQLKFPDRKQTWHSWQRMIIEEQLVTDAVSIYVRPDQGGRPYSFDLIAGKTIRPLLDSTGRQPDAPEPAYQQILKGMPAINYTSDELIYMPRNPRPGKIYGMCYTPDHEVLTRRGWLPFVQVRPDDEIATRNQLTKAFEWQRPTRIITMPHDGEVLHFGSVSVDLLVTPDHNMLLDSMPKMANGGVKRGRGSKYTGEVLVPAHLVALGHNHMNKIPMTSEWSGVPVADRQFDMPDPGPTQNYRLTLRDGSVVDHVRAGHRGNERPLWMTGNDYCALMGAYLAEGNRRTQGGIEIAQLVTSKGYKLYKALLDRIVGSECPHNGRSFILARRGLNEHFSQFGLAHEKFVPDEIMNGSKENLETFWEYYMAGDGCYETLKNVSGRGQQKIRQSITTASERMAGQLQEIAQKLGWSASIRRGNRAGPQLIMGRLCNVRDSFIVSVRYSKAMGFTISEQHYKGDVHCVTVPNGVIYVRRNGKPAWCGNSPVQQVILTVNISIRREIAKLSYYVEGNVPEALVSVPEGWSGEQIAQFQSIWDAMMTDQFAQRRKLKFIPGGSQYTPTREASSMFDQFDEWIARMVSFCFSLPPTAFVAAVNRATAESAYDAAIAEGLDPMMLWFKSIMDRIVQHDFGYPDLEFVWDEIDDTDPADQQAADLNMIRMGVKSIDEVRARMGLQPIGMDHALFGIGPLGITFVDDLVKAHAQGLTAIQPPPPPMVMGPNGQPMPAPGAAGMGAPGMGAPPGALPPPQVDAATPPGQPSQVEQMPDLAGIPANLLAAVGLGPQGSAGRSVDVTGDEEMQSDPIAPHVGHPAMIGDIRSIEQLQQGYGR